MGGGTGDVSEITAGNKGWQYPTPDSSMESILKQVCSR